ncbi:hypothetical protein TNCV_1546981 [Trichonephila clavipes]|nr:hypothetical protein TNCV_1546981 [Trichonephila clavipes]
MTIIEDVSGEAQGSVPILLSLLQAKQTLNQELLSGATFHLKAGRLWSSLEHTYSPAVRRRHSENCFATVPLAAPWPQFSDMMGRRLHLTGNVHDLARQLVKICQEIRQETTRVLYQSVALRVTVCIQARGGSTPY